MRAAVGGIPVAPRVVGAALGSGISLSAAVIFAGVANAGVLRWFIASEVLAFCGLGAAIGVPVGGLLGWIHTPGAVSSQGSARLGLVARLASLSVLLGAALFSIVMAFGGLLAGDMLSLGVGAASFVMLFTFGLIIFGLPAWVLAAAVCALWVIAAHELLDNRGLVDPANAR